MVHISHCPKKKVAREPAPIIFISEVTAPQIEPKEKPYGRNIVTGFSFH
jgi:hypothetical protein